MATILITGGTGLVGKQLTQLFISKGYDVNILTRTIPAKKAHQNIHYFLWDVTAGTIDSKAIETADHIVHLAGAGVADARWTKKRKQEIVDSRVQSCQLIVKALGTVNNKVQSIISASAIGWYGADTPISLRDGFVETAPADTEFLGETCRLWESTMQPVLALNKRLVQLRIGIVLSNDGGALLEFKKPIKMGVAAILGSGHQVISWIHIADLCNLILFGIENNSMQGIYNAVAPETITNKALTLALAKKMRGDFFIPMHVPAFVLKIMLGEMSIEVLKSATVNSFKTQSTGFHYNYPTINLALDQLCNKHLR